MANAAHLSSARPLPSLSSAEKLGFSSCDCFVHSFWKDSSWEAARLMQIDAAECAQVVHVGFCDNIFTTCC